MESFDWHPDEIYFDRVPLLIMSPYNSEIICNPRIMEPSQKRLKLFHLGPSSDVFIEI